MQIRRFGYGRCSTRCVFVWFTVFEEHERDAFGIISSKKKAMSERSLPTYSQCLMNWTTAQTAPPGGTASLQENSPSPPKQTQVLASRGFTRSHLSILRFRFMSLCVPTPRFHYDKLTPHTTAAAHARRQLNRCTAQHLHTTHFGSKLSTSTVVTTAVLSHFAQSANPQTLFQCLCAMGETPTIRPFNRPHACSFVY